MLLVTRETTGPFSKYGINHSLDKKKNLAISFEKCFVYALKHRGKINKLIYVIV